MKKQEVKKNTPEFIFVQTTSCVVAYCTRCVMCRNGCKQVLRVEDLKCCGCKVCGK